MQDEQQQAEQHADQQQEDEWYGCHGLNDILRILLAMEPVYLILIAFEVLTQDVVYIGCLRDLSRIQTLDDASYRLLGLDRNINGCARTGIIVVQECRTEIGAAAARAAWGLFLRGHVSDRRSTGT